MNKTKHPDGASLSTVPPSGWNRVRLSELCVQDRQIVEPNSDAARSRPYLGLEHIESNTGRILRPSDASSDDEGKSTTFAFDIRHVLYGKLRPYLNKVALPAFDGRCTTELIPLLPREGVSRQYLAWLLRSPTTVNAAMRQKTGSRMPRADMSHVLALQVLIPLDPEMQDRIASELSVRMSAVAMARHVLQEQLQLVDILSSKLLEQFPDVIVSSKAE